MYIYTHMCTCVYMHVCVYIYIYIYIFVYVIGMCTLYRGGYACMYIYTQRDVAYREGYNIAYYIILHDVML